MSRLTSIPLTETKPGLVSVLIPAFNHEQYVQETLRSIIAQTYSQIELLVIDDGSKDSTWKKIHELRSACEARFQRTVFLTQENQGTTGTLNRLVSMAHGEYVYLIASDDIAFPEAIQTELDFLTAHPDYALAVGDNLIIDENGNLAAIDKNWQILPLGTENTSSTFAEHLQKCSDIDFRTWKFGTYSVLFRGNHIPNGYLIRKSIFSKIPAFCKEAPLEDYFLMLQIAKHAKIKFLDVPLFYYRRHSGGTSQNHLLMHEMTEKTRNFEKYTWQFYFPLRGFFIFKYYHRQYLWNLEKQKGLSWDRQKIQKNLLIYFPYLIKYLVLGKYFQHTLPLICIFYDMTIGLRNTLNPRKTIHEFFQIFQNLTQKIQHHM